MLSRPSHLLLLLSLASATCSITLPPGVGESCTTAAECDFNLACVDRRCRTTTGLGDSCEHIRDCRSPNFVCIGGRCGPLADIGEECDDVFDCREGNPCVDGSCANYTALGEACSETADCQGVFCDSTACGRLRSAGGACSTTVDCIGVTQCVSGTCAYPGEVGDTCMESDHCVAELECNDSICCDNEGVCSPKAPFGETCVSAAGNCPSPEETLACIERSCRRLSPVGGPCGTSHDCWEANPCENGLCVVYDNLGQPCSNFSTDCQNVGCIHRTCVGQSGIGGMCFENESIPGDWCVGNLVCVSEICQRRRLRGEQCEEDDDCFDDLKCQQSACCDADGNCSMESSGTNVGAIVGGVLGGLAGIAVVATIVVVLVLRRRSEGSDPSPSDRIDGTTTTATTTALPASEPQLAGPERVFEPTPTPLDATQSTAVWPSDARPPERMGDIETHAPRPDPGYAPEQQHVDVTQSTATMIWPQDTRPPQHMQSDTPF